MRSVTIVMYQVQTHGTKIIEHYIYIIFEVGVSQILSMIGNLKSDGKEIHKTANTQKLPELPNTL